MYTLNGEPPNVIGVGSGPPTETLPANKAHGSTTLTRKVEAVKMDGALNDTNTGINPAIVAPLGAGVVGKVPPVPVKNTIGSVTRSM